MMLGNVRWALDLAKYLIDDLFEMSDNLENTSADSDFGFLSGWCSITERYKH